MSKKLYALSVVIVMTFTLLVASGCKTDEKVRALEQCSKNLKPTTEEVALIKQYLGFEHEIIDSIKIDTPKPFIISIIKSCETNIWAFRFDKKRIEKIYKSQNIYERKHKFGYLNEGIQKDGLWGMVFKGYILCPVTIVTDYDNHNRDYNIIRMLAINNNFDLIELQTNWDGRKFQIQNEYDSQVFEYHQGIGLKRIENAEHNEGFYVEQMEKNFELKEKSLISDELAIKILRIYYNSLNGRQQQADKYKYELQLLINQLKKNPTITSYIDRMHDRFALFTIDLGVDLPSIPLSWDISIIGSKDELMFSNNWSIKKILWNIIQPLLPKDKEIINIRTYDTIEFSYVFAIVEGDKPFERGTCLYGELGNSLLCFIFKNNKLVRQEILLENSCSIELAESNFYNRGDPYYKDYLDMDPWGMDFEDGKIFHFINSNSSGNCWGCATSYFLWIKDGEILNLNYQPYPEDYGSSIRGISFEDGKLVFYGVLWGYEYFQGQSHAGSPKIHLIYELENGKLVNKTKNHLRFVESEIDGARSYTPISAMAKISLLAREAGLIDKYWPLIEEIAMDSKDERTMSYLNDLKKELKR